MNAGRARHPAPVLTFTKMSGGGNDFLVVSEEALPPHVWYKPALSDSNVWPPATAMGLVVGTAVPVSK